MAIIDAMRGDGRVAFAQVAEQLGVSPGMVRQRYNRLVEQGFLKVVAITNPLRMGYKAVRVQAAVPGLDATYGVGKGKLHYEPAEKGLPPTGNWSTSAYLAFAPQLFARVREEFGPELSLLHDVHHRLTPIEAARLGKELEPYHLFWMEDPVPAELQEGFRLIRRHTTTPIAVGEVFSSIHDCETLIREQLIDFIRATVVHAGGIGRRGRQPHVDDEVEHRGVAAVGRHLAELVGELGAGERQLGGGDRVAIDRGDHRFRRDLLGKGGGEGSRNRCGGEHGEGAGSPAGNQAWQRHGVGPVRPWGFWFFPLRPSGRSGAGRRAAPTPRR